MLKITNISFSFPGRVLFRDLDLTLDSGELVHLRGPNGAGKSTFMRICAGLLTPHSGSVDCNPENFGYLMAEANGFHLKLGASANLAFWYELRHGKPPLHAEVSRILGDWNLNHPLIETGLPVGKFSTGMKRRLALARMDLLGTPLWLLDEPVSGLDEDAVASFVATMRRHLSRGGAALVISHDTRIFDGIPCREFALGTGSLAASGIVKTSGGSQ